MLAAVAERLDQRRRLQVALQQQILAVVLARIVGDAADQPAGMEEQLFLAALAAHHEHAGAALVAGPLQQRGGREDGQTSGEFHCPG